MLTASGNTWERLASLRADLRALRYEAFVAGGELDLAAMLEEADPFRELDPQSAVYRYRADVPELVAEVLALRTQLAALTEGVEA